MLDLIPTEKATLIKIGEGKPSSYPIREQSALVMSNVILNQDYRHLILSCSPSAAGGAPGQFFHLLCPPSPGDSPFLRRPMSIYGSDPERGSIEFLYKVTGAGTRGLALLRPDDHLNMVGPLGIGFRLDSTFRSIVIAGRGVGLATLAPLASLACQTGIAVTAILSARTPEFLMCVEAFARPGSTVVTVTDTEGTSSMPNVDRIIRALAEEKRADALFTCGSRRLTALLQKIGRRMNIPGQVAVEQQMACGLGMCFCCVKTFRTAERVQQRRVCIEGPVFDLAEVLP